MSSPTSNLASWLHSSLYFCITASAESPKTTVEPSDATDGVTPGPSPQLSHLATYQDHESKASSGQDREGKAAIDEDQEKRPAIDDQDLQAAIGKGRKLQDSTDQDQQYKSLEALSDAVEVSAYEQKTGSAEKMLKILPDKKDDGNSLSHAHKALLL